MLRVSFSSETYARSAASVLTAYGYSAKQRGLEVVTDCPPLLAVPAIQKQIGFAHVARLDLNGQDDTIAPTTFGDAPSPARFAGGPELRI